MDSGVLERKIHRAANAEYDKKMETSLRQWKSSRCNFCWLPESIWQYLPQKTVNENYMKVESQVTYMNGSWIIYKTKNSTSQ